MTQLAYYDCEYIKFHIRKYYKNQSFQRNINFKVYVSIVLSFNKIIISAQGLYVHMYSKIHLLYNKQYIYIKKLSMTSSLLENAKSKTKKFI